MKKLLAWVIESWFAEEWVSKLDCDAAVEKHRLETIKVRAAVAKETARNVAAIARLTRERNAVLAEGLHRFGMLPKASGPRGTVEMNVDLCGIVKHSRPDFRVGVSVELKSDECAPLAGPMRAVVIEQLAMMLLESLKRELNEKLVNGTRLTLAVADE